MEEVLCTPMGEGSRVTMLRLTYEETMVLKNVPGLQLYGWYTEEVAHPRPWCISPENTRRVDDLYSGKEYGNAGHVYIKRSGEEEGCEEA